MTTARVCYLSLVTSSRVEELAERGTPKRSWMSCCQQHRLLAGRRTQHLLQGSEADFLLHYSRATAGISVGAGGALCPSMCRETHMANRSSLKTLHHDSLCCGRHSGSTRWLLCRGKKSPLWVFPFWESIAVVATKSS